MSDGLSRLVADALGLSADEISDSIGPGNGWTSLQHLRIVAAVEDAFAVAFTPRQVRQITSFGRLRELLQDRGVLA
jgi:acyl carrier protein